MSSHIEEGPLPFLMRFLKPMKGCVPYSGGWTGVAEAVVEIQVEWLGIVFMRHYPC